jgi:hypothetical protein
MRAEPRDFQSATPTGFAEQTAHDQAEVDPSQIHVLAGGGIDAASSISSGWDGRLAPNFDVGDPRRMGIRWIGIRSIGRLSEILNRLRVWATVRSSSIGGALVVAFGLGWACASISHSNPSADLSPLDQKADVSPRRLESEKQAVRPHHSIANAAAATNPAPVGSNKPKLSASAASAGLSFSGSAQMHPEPVSQSMQERGPPLRPPSTSSDSNPLLQPSPVPETKPTTIAGWTVRDVYGETAVLVGPDHVWTAKTGDTVPGVGRIDTIVRWGNRWIVATTAGLISTD